MNRLSAVETRVVHLISQSADLRADLRALSSKTDNVTVLLAGVTIASTLGLAALIAKGFHWF